MVVIDDVDGDAYERIDRIAAVDGGAGMIEIAAQSICRAGLSYGALVADAIASVAEAAFAVGETPCCAI
ncbi:hypothetical protein ACQP0C_18160 [Nocardia sp. CA-129566]|uniref:hypothetical protein n=1 Tax=Nocardia sp. CA-129566 TaxID=3239976 RepID=UPI003D963F62